ncbi:putative F-box domain-containing protein [Helianthus annuus]|nr:putative F-box domain-containing protein [Helianthus annuus]
MSDNIPFDLQKIIINKLPVELEEIILNKLPVKPLIRFRSVCKAWKSLIDSSDFILKHRQHQHQHLLVRYKDAVNLELKYVSIADTDTDTFPQNTVSVTVPQSVVHLEEPYTTIDSPHGLLCLFSITDRKAVIWNPSLRKAVDVVLPDIADDEMYRTVLGFGVCRETRDPKIVKIKMDTKIHKEGGVYVFTLSTGIWRSVYSSNVPSKVIIFGEEQVVVGGVVYWLAVPRFGEVKLPDRLAHTHCNLSMLKPRESLVAIEGCVEDSELVYHVWVMKDGVPKLFEKLFTISSHSPYGSLNSIRGFRKTGEALVELQAHCSIRTLAAYEPYSKSIKNIGTSEKHIYVYSYTETLLLLDQPVITN